MMPKHGLYSSIQKQPLLDELGNYEHVSTNEITPLFRKSKETRHFSQWKSLLGTVSLAPVVFLQIFAVNLISVVTQNFYIGRICRVSFNLDEEACQNLTSNVVSEEITVDLKLQVDSLTSRFGLYSDVIETVLQIISSLYLQSWSDKRGRRPVILICLFGHVVTFGLYTLFNYLSDLPPEYFLLARIPASMFGGSTILVIVAFSHIASVTAPKNRSFPMGILETCVLFGIPLGSLLGAMVYKGSGYAGVYLVAIGSILVAMAYTIVCFHDENSKQHQYSSCSSDSCDISDVKDAFFSTFKRRDGNKRTWIIVLLVATCCNMVARYGPSNCLFLFTRYMFGWNEQQHSMLNTVEGTLNAVGVLLISFGGSKLLKLEDCMIGFISACGCIAANVLVACVPRDPSTSWIMYMSTTLGMFGMMSTAIIRAKLSKIVPIDELSKALTIFSCLDMCMPVMAGSFYSIIFTSTEAYFPGAFSLLSAGLNFSVGSAFAYLYFAEKRKRVL